MSKSYVFKGLLPAYLYFIYIQVVFCFLENLVAVLTAYFTHSFVLQWPCQCDSGLCSSHILSVLLSHVVIKISNLSERTSMFNTHNVFFYSENENVFEVHQEVLKINVSLLA